MSAREQLIAALEIGLEHTQSALSRHEVDLGRTTHSNNAEAEALEDELKQIQDAIALLKQIAIGRWVPVEERLPEFDGDGRFSGLIRTSDERTRAGLFDWEICKGIITHWLELDVPTG